MNEQSIQDQYRYIINLLRQQRLKEAQSQLEAFLWNSSDRVLRGRLEQMQTSYQYLLQYLRQGTDDPERRRLYRQIWAGTWEIADRARLSLMDETSMHYYHLARKRTPARDMAALQRVSEAYPDELAVCRLMPDNEGLDGVLQRHEDAVRELFLLTWCNSDWSAEEREQADRMLKSETVYVNDLCVMVSAVMLSLTECFDSRKFAWLTEAATHADAQVSQRALVGIVIVLMIHAARLHLYPELTAHLSLLDEDGKFGKELNRVYIELLRCRETEKIDRKMREEIIPEVMKNVNKMRNMKFGFEENPDENDRNPDWEQAIDAPELGDKLREMNELQMEGADVYMGTFAQLKNYPFFKEACNWFYPFDLSHSCIVKEFGLKPTELNVILPFVLRSGFFCNSDKYSLCLTIAHIPKAQRDQIFVQLSAQAADESQETKEFVSALHLHAQRPEIICNQYIHDLYRFYKLNPRRSEFRDIFKEEIALHRIPVLREMLCKPKLLKQVADYQFVKEHPAEALPLYQELIAMNEADADTFQKAGYCLQKEKRYREAIDAYLKADLLHPDNIWTIRHLATCHRLTKEFCSALEYYKKIEEIQPENHQILFYAGSCLAGMERYDEALQYFFKLDFVENDCVKAWRAIGWCLFICGKREQAMKYYEKILALEPTAADYLNAGHVAWTSGDIDRAAGLYTEAAAKCESREMFREMLLKDKDLLLKQGIDEETIPLILDLI